jgi:23S rRNA (cytosine1962-C5)-methyltransferase
VGKKANRAKPPGRLRLRITATAEAQVRAGHPWIFSNSVREQNREGISGELAAIYDRKDEFLAVGFFDPESPIRVRVLHTGKPMAIDEAFWKTRLHTALGRREGLFDDRTTGYRIINGESEGWPGLVLDRYGPILVVKIYTAAWVDRLSLLTVLIRECVSTDAIVVRISRNIQTSAGPVKDGTWLYQSETTKTTNGKVVFLENGLRLEADVLRGQKTGFFLDQRENRQSVGGLAHGRSVLNAFSFSGGFSLYAARGEAKSVSDLDISAHALSAAKRNFELNATDPSVARCHHETIQADAFEWLAKKPERKFGLIVLDPPSLAKRESERAGAIRAYEKLAASAIAHLTTNGILVACSCSAHVSAEEFFASVRRAFEKSRRKFAELKTTRNAADHPATFKEAEYLKAVYVRAINGKR